MVHNFVNAFLKEEDGQDLVEYSLLMAFIGLAATAVLSTIHSSLTTIWTNINTQMTAAKTAS
ncbi:MAG TPA: Flp family type IVb pilin [Bryobacteraceae bacterium]|jgi:pilus assembly protein Flp/PilA|nr:Flp family type IVb pilin [Bryobacteraceae bacterium]